MGPEGYGTKKWLLSPAEGYYRVARVAILFLFGFKSCCGTSYGPFGLLEGFLGPELRLSVSRRGGTELRTNPRNFSI